MKKYIIPSTDFQALTVKTFVCGVGSVKTSEQEQAEGHPQLAPIFRE